MGAGLKPDDRLDRGPRRCCGLRFEQDLDRHGSVDGLQGGEFAVSRIDSLESHELYSPHGVTGGDRHDRRLALTNGRVIARRRGIEVPIGFRDKPHAERPQPLSTAAGPRGPERGFQFRMGSLRGVRRGGHILQRTRSEWCRDRSGIGGGRSTLCTGPKGERFGRSTGIVATELHAHGAVDRSGLARRIGRERRLPGDFARVLLDNEPLPPGNVVDRADVRGLIRTKRARRDLRRILRHDDPRRLRAARLLFHRIEMPALFERRGHG